MEAVAEMDEDKRLSNVAIAKRVGVSEHLVRHMKLDLVEFSPEEGAAVEEKIRELEEVS